MACFPASWLGTTALGPRPNDQEEKRPANKRGLAAVRVFHFGSLKACDMGCPKKLWGRSLKWKLQLFESFITRRGSETNSPLSETTGGCFSSASITPVACKQRKGHGRQRCAGPIEVKIHGEGTWRSANQTTKDWYLLDKRHASTCRTQTEMMGTSLSPGHVKMKAQLPFMNCHHI